MPTDVAPAAGVATGGSSRGKLHALNWKTPFPDRVLSSIAVVGCPGPGFVEATVVGNVCCQRSLGVFVAASTRCFADLPLDAALQRLVDLEYTCVEIMIHETDGHLKPSEVLADLDAAVRACRQTHRLTPIAFSVEIDLPESRGRDRRITTSLPPAASWPRRARW